MIENNSMDPLMYLGKICPRQHDYNNTGKSLRYKSNYDCKECSILLRRKRHGSRVRIFYNKNTPRPEGIPIPAGHYLGWLCKHNHNYLDTGYSLRNKSRSCVVCVSLQSRSLKSKERTKRWKDDHPGYMTQYLRLYQKENKEQITERRKDYSKTPKGKACKQISRNKRRAKIKNVTRIPYNSASLVSHFEKFGNQCVYCGTTEKIGGDHVIPMSKNGIDSLDNILPCCISCNNSKQGSDYFE